MRRLQLLAVAAVLRATIAAVLPIRAPMTMPTLTDGAGASSPRGWRK
jgi:hypothetical protein